MCSRELTKQQNFKLDQIQSICRWRIIFGSSVWIGSWKITQEGHDGPGSLTWVIFPTIEFYIFVPKVPTCEIDKGPQRDAKYEISKLSFFQFQRRRILKLIFLVPMIQLVTNLWLPGRGQFWPHKHHINYLGRGPQGDANTKYQALCISVQRRRILKMRFFLPMFKLVTPQGWDQSWPQEHHVNKLSRGPLQDAT